MSRKHGKSGKSKQFPSSSKKPQSGKEPTNPSSSSGAAQSANSKPSPLLPKPSQPSQLDKAENPPNPPSSSPNPPQPTNQQHDNSSPPSPWLNAQEKPQPHASAGFTEYLRWMRSPDSEYKDPTKVQILQLATQKGDYKTRLDQLKQRTILIAGKENTFTVKCPWRIRVGGHKGPENILLPAFDTLGMPYIPSSSLRGVARTQAIRETMELNNWSWSQAEEAIAPYFGSLNTEEAANKAGKVVFLDAYPMATNDNKKGGLAMDMANNIWQWQDNQPELKYSPNPNPFLSLENPQFLIGLRLASNCQNPQVLEKVKTWLIKGLEEGIGSQINTGYGSLINNENSKIPREFFRVEFELEGQLIHGHQQFADVNQPFQQNNHGNWQAYGKAQPEVRATAFKSMLRYWFRTFALGVLSPQKVQEWEAKLFGAIKPTRAIGWLKVEVLKGKTVRREPAKNNENCGLQEGVLVLALSAETSYHKEQQDTIKSMAENLVWLMFNLGGIGQGARRPCYSRQNRQYRPWYRGSTFIIDSQDDFWEQPEDLSSFGRLFQKRLVNFYKYLAKLTETAIDYKHPKTVGSVNTGQWNEAVDANCRIVLCKGKPNQNKVYALEVLHSQQFKINNNYDGNLCGKVAHGVKPSPVWITDLEDYQVVTIFGATANPRQDYLKVLKQKGNCQQIFPFSQT